MNALICSAFSDDVIRCAPERDSCNGFFVACLVRGGGDVDTTSPGGDVQLEGVGSAESSDEPLSEPSATPPPPRRRARPRVRHGRWRITLHDT